MSGRWQTVPVDPVPVRRELIFWRKGSAVMIRQWIERQGPAVKEWVTQHGKAYEAGYPGEKPERLWHEAAVDLLAWQRGGVSPGKAMDWLREWNANLESAR